MEDEEIKRRIKETYVKPLPEKGFRPSSRILAKWVEDREEEKAELSLMNPRNWNPSIRDRFLDAWWFLRPGLYKQSHKEFKGVGYEMISDLKYYHPSIFERIWDEVATQELEEFHPPRP